MRTPRAQDSRTGAALAQRWLAEARVRRV